MYQPSEFTGGDHAAAYDHIQRFPFGIIVSVDGLRATHLPFLVDDPRDPGGVLSHFAIRNEQWRSIRDGDEVLVIFSGPESYVSSSVYRAENDVPTWNYTTVHIRGSYRRMSEAETRDLLERTVAAFESGQPAPWSLRSMPAPDLALLGRAVVGFSVTTRVLEHGVKLSQDKLQEDVDAVHASLAKGDAAARAVADEMRRQAVQGRRAHPSTDPAGYLSDELGSPVSCESTRLADHEEG